jgi:hypothetical protein
MCSQHPDSKLLCPICDRKQILKIAKEVISQRGRRGALKQSQQMTDAERRERAKKAARARWEKDR